MMSDDVFNWFEYVDNNSALMGMLGGRPPSLKNVRLAQLVIGEMAEVKLSLNLPLRIGSLPNSWEAKGFDSIQLRFACYDVEKMSLEGKMQESGLELDAVFDENCVFVIANADFRIELHYGYIRVEVYPYNSRVFEEPKNWFHQ
jgi:hypothetical protein